MQLCNFVSSRPHETHRSPLTKFMQLLMTLMKLHLNISNERLEFMFSITISKSTVSKIFLNTRCSVHHVASTHHLARTWWTKEDHWHGPSSCPWSSLNHRRNSIESLTWSSYKHHNTVKFLKGITPQGTISSVLFLLEIKLITGTHTLCR